MRKFNDCIKYFLSFRHYLATQLFIYFTLAFLLILFFAFNISKLDDREFSPISDKKLAYFTAESKQTARLYNLDDIFERDLSIRTPDGLDVVLVEKNTGAVSGMNQDNIKPLLAFLYRAEEAKAPLGRSFNDIRIYGPFSVNTLQREFNEYFVERIEAQPEIYNRIFDSSWLLSLISMLAGVPILLFLSWRISRPVKKLRLAADAVASGDLKIHPEIEEKGIKELRNVGRSFNQMVGSLQALNHYQQRLLADISHELKTPLARLQLATAIIRRQQGESKEVIRIENEIKKLDTMILDLLSLSRQQVNSHLSRTVFPVQAIWDEILDDAQFEMRENGLKFVVKNQILPSANYCLNGNSTTLASALENVIRNAKKYARTMVSVKMEVVKENLIIQIEDDGTGVPESEYEQIFRPFYRVDEARDRQTGGTGLGLAIVLNAVQQHNGTVVASKSSLGGLRVTFTLPLWCE